MGAEMGAEMTARLIAWGPRIKHRRKGGPRSSTLWPSLVDGLAAGLGDAIRKMSTRFLPTLVWVFFVVQLLFSLAVCVRVVMAAGEGSMIKEPICNTKAGAGATHYAGLCYYCGILGWGVPHTATCM